MEQDEGNDAIEGLDPQDMLEAAPADDEGDPHEDTTPEDVKPDPYALPVEYDDEEV